MQKQLITLLSVVLMVSASAGAAAADKTKPAASRGYGALAVDRSKNFVYGFAYDNATKDDASARALKECSKRKGNCTVVVEFSGKGCASYATIAAAKGDAYGWATDKTMDRAKSRAREFCEGFSGGETCGNHVWACNAKGADDFRADREEPMFVARECYIQFEAQLDRADNGDWVGRFYSPVYHLKAENCPSISNKNDSIYGGGAVYYENLPAYKAADNAKTDPSGRSQQMAQQFYDWLIKQRSPYGQAKFRTVGSVTVTSTKPALLSELVKRNEQLDSGISQKSLPGAVPTCLDFKLADVTPIEVHGASGCRRWVK
jgi:hypothetical protein